MRRIFAATAVAALVLAAGAYAAAAVSNQYVLNVAVSPHKHASRAHPVSISTDLGWTVTTSPAGYRPGLVSKYRFSYQNVRENTDHFPACGSSRVLDPSQGPNSCPAGSKIGTGYFIAEVGPPSDQRSVVLTCRAEFTLYNGGNHTLTLYVYTGHQVAGQPAPCPLPSKSGYAIVQSLKNTRAGLLQTFSTPKSLLHPVPGEDASVVKSVVHVRALSAPVGKGKRRHRVGLFEEYGCAPNHHDQAAATFTTTDGTSRTATRLVPCE